MTPLEGIKVVELANIGPAPYAGMVLADMGAEVVSVVRPDTPPAERYGNAHVLRGRTTVVADLKEKAARDAVIALSRHADVLIEGFRPGVAERLGVGPADCRAVNERLVYARMTGWGQTGPLAQSSGHDINYISITGALHAIGPRELPLPPLSLVGNYGGGSMFLIAGVLAALLRRERTGLGDVLDIATVDGTCSLLQPILQFHGQGEWSDTRADNLLDGGAPFYRTYECSDGKHMAVGAIEPQFFAALLAGLGLDEVTLPGQYEKQEWDVLAAAIAGAFKRHPRAHWTAIFQQADACVSPVLSFGEAAGHPHITERGSLRAGPSGVVAAPAPRFADAGQASGAARSATATLAAVLANWQCDERN